MIEQLFDKTVKIKRRTVYKYQTPKVEDSIELEKN